MSEWWLWKKDQKLTVANPKLKIVGKFELPWSYIADAGPLPYNANQEIGSDMRRTVLPMIGRKGIYGSYDRQNIGRMRAVRIQELRSRGKSYLLTPPLYKFLAMSAFRPSSSFGHPDYWIQPEVFHATGSIFFGSPDQLLEPMSLEKIQTEARHEMKLEAKHKDDESTMGPMGLALAALDSFLERGSPDPKFLQKQKHASHLAKGTKRLTTTQIKRDIADALKSRPRSKTNRR